VGLRVLANAGPFVGGSQRGMTVALLTAALVNVLVNIALVPILGLRGAAIATFLAQGVAALLTLLFAERSHRIGYELRIPALLFSVGFALAVARSELPSGPLERVSPILCLVIFAVLIRSVRWPVPGGAGKRDADDLLLHVPIGEGTRPG
jgi:Na+-driven multidrug efflux pump